MYEFITGHGESNICEFCHRTVKVWWRDGQHITCNRCRYENETKGTLRVGQKAFNDLYHSDPDIADQIRGTMCDPFYVDARMEAFEERVKELRNKD